MALKPDREYNETTDLRYHWSDVVAQATAEKGGIACQEGVSSGVAMDASGNIVQYRANGSGGVPVGVLLQDVNPVMSATRDFPDLQSGEKRPGDKVTLLRKGFCTTDTISGTITAGGTLYVGDSGNLTGNLISAGHAVVGRIETTADANGFVTVFIDI